jgi:hypothetical protein
LVELKYFQHVGFELVGNHLTPGSIKVTTMFVHHYHNLPILDNNVAVNNDPNDMFGKAFINDYLFEISNPKGYVHS